MNFWQLFETADPPPAAAIFHDCYPARMPDGTCLRLPLRDLGDEAVAGLIANQASFAVVDRLAGWMVQSVQHLQPEVVVGLPTLGHVFGAAVARALGHSNWVAPGTTRKLWYDTALSVPLSSITAPAGGRRMWLDPRLLSRLQGRRVLLVDDVISTGASCLAGLTLLRLVDIQPVAVAVAMLQTQRWRTALAALHPPAPPVFGAFASPLFRAVSGGWSPV